MRPHRTLVLADTHCGHRSGLTPPAYQYSTHAKDAARRKYAKLQGLMWDWYCTTLDGLRPFDACIVNGDAIEGKGERSGGTELITTNRDEQCSMAEECIAVARPKATHLIYGTSSHTGTDEDWESVLAESVGAEIGSHDWYTHNGVTIDCKHHIGSSSVPHGRHTAIARDRLWAQLWSLHGAAPSSQIILRSHVHYHVGAFGPGWAAMTTPCLQAWTKYGSRRCSGLIDIGVVTIDITEGGDFSWQVHLFDLRQIATVAREL